MKAATMSGVGLASRACACVACLSRSGIATTDANGEYLFDELVPGTYTVTVDDVALGYIENTAVATGTDSNGDPVTDTSDAGDDTVETPPAAAEISMVPELYVPVADEAVAKEIDGAHARDPRRRPAFRG